METRDGFNPAAPDSIGVPVFSSFDAAEEFCRISGSEYRASNAGKSWLKVIGPRHEAHYEFEHGRISMITLMLPT